MAFLLTLQCVAAVLPKCTRVTMDARAADPVQPSAPPRMWRPWMVNVWRPWEEVMFTMGNKLGVRSFNWVENPDGVVRRVLISAGTTLVPGKIIRWNARRMHDATRLYGREYFHKAALKAENANFQWAHLGVWLREAGRIDIDNFVMFALLGEDSSGSDFLLGYVVGIADDKHALLELEAVETAPAFRQLGVAKVLSTYVLLETKRRGYCQARVDNAAGLAGVMAYLPAAVNAGFTHVRLRMRWDAPDPSGVADADYNLITVDDMELTEHVITRLCKEVLEALALYGKSCVCDHYSPHHCFSAIEVELQQFTFTQPSTAP